MNHEALARAVYDAAHITGTFTLRSGLVSNEYFDKYLFEAKPDVLRGIAHAMAPLIPAGTEIIAGLEMGGIPIVTALSLETGMQAAFVRKQAKAYGTCKLAEGADIQGKRVCIIEDIITTGGQQLESAAALRERGAVVDTVLCVILRNEAAVEALAREELTARPLFTMAYLQKIAQGCEAGDITLV